MASFANDGRDNVKFSNQNRTISRTKSIGYDTCYGSSWMDREHSKLHTYKIQVDKVDEFVWIGIATNENHKDSSGTSYPGNGALSCGNPTAYLYKTSTASEEVDFTISSGDVVTLIINFTNKSIIYKLNDVTKCQDKIQNVPYKLAITMGEVAQVTILEYKSESADDIKEQTEFKVKSPCSSTLCR